ncbi:MAG: S-adenosylmethionine:tRNA ribosyltransferase-isomerase [Bdellovibrionales bacterium]|nr:S-adenosylmethionine:tRNA ribosyltransferase-isomerase [Bdellovibrionales bacterium]
MLKPATVRSDSASLLVLSPTEMEIAPFTDLARFARAGDVWVVNDAATFPASLAGRTDRGEAIELRLLPRRPGTTGPWEAVAFGAGDWRMRTEDRPAPTLALGDRLRFSGNVSGIVATRSPLSDRLIACDFGLSEAETWAMIYRIGNPVQYSYLPEALAIWSVQTPFAARPWATEMPSAGRPLEWSRLRELRAAGAELHFLTHATGLSSTGDSTLDSALPLPEFFDIPEPTVSAIRRAKTRGSRVIAVGTSVTRALEGSTLAHGTLRPGLGETALKIDASYPHRVVNGILTGLHSPGESHFELLRSFLPRERFAKAESLAEKYALRTHEFGDASLVLSA